MKFKISLLILLIGYGQSLFPEGLEQKYNLGQKVTIGDCTWEVGNIETINPSKGKYGSAKLSSQPKIIYTFKRPILPYFLNIQIKKTQKKGDTNIKFRKSDPSFYKITPLGTITLGSVSLLALYSLYSYFSK